MSNGQWETWNGPTHAFYEMLSPALVLPWQFSCAFEPDKEFPLEVEQFVEIGEEKVYCVLIDDVSL